MTSGVLSGPIRGVSCIPTFFVVGLGLTSILQANTQRGDLIEEFYVELLFQQGDEVPGGTSQIPKALKSQAQIAQGLKEIG